MANKIEVFKNNIYTLYYTIEKEGCYYNYDGPLNKIIKVRCHSPKYGLTFSLKTYDIPYDDDGTILNKTIFDIESNVITEVTPKIIPRIKEELTRELNWKQTCIKETEDKIKALTNLANNYEQRVKELNRQIKEL